MPRYRAIKKLWDGQSIRNPGEVFEFVGPGNPDTMAPINGAPMAARRHDVEGGAGLSLEKRSELVATRKPADY